jgi:hypothetical protein
MPTPGTSSISNPPAQQAGDAVEPVRGLPTITVLSPGYQRLKFLWHIDTLTQSIYEMSCFTTRLLEA